MFILNAVLQVITTAHNLLETMNPFESFVTYFTCISCMSHASSFVYDMFTSGCYSWYTSHCKCFTLMLGSRFGVEEPLFF